MIGSEKMKMSVSGLVMILDKYFFIIIINYFI